MVKVILSQGSLSDVRKNSELLTGEGIAWILEKPPPKHKATIKALGTPDPELIGSILYQHIIVNIQKFQRSSKADHS